MEICQFGSKTELLATVKKSSASLSARLLFFRSASGEMQVGETKYTTLNNSAFTFKKLKTNVFSALSEECFGSLLSFTPQDRDAILIDSFSLCSPVKSEQFILLQDKQAAQVEFFLSGLQWLSCHDNTHLEYERRWLIQLVVDGIDHSLNEKIEMGLLMHPTIQKFTQAVDERFRTCHNVEVYCKAIGASCRTLGRLMKEQMQMTPKELITHRVNTEAKRLLIGTHLPVQQLAYQLGFSSADNFHNFFKRLNNTAPQDYRKNFSIAAKF